MHTIDFNGKSFHSVEEMCAAYGKTVNTYRRRLQCGMSQKAALCTPVRVSGPARTTDYLGNKFPSERAMCQFYGRDVQTFRQRMEYGWSLEDALTRPPMHS